MTDRTDAFQDYINSLVESHETPETLDPAAQAIHDHLSAVANYLDIDTDRLIIRFSVWRKNMTNFPGELLAEHIRQMVINENKLLPWFYPVLVNGEKSLPDKFNRIHLSQGDGVQVGHRSSTISIREPGLYQISAATGELSPIGDNREF